MLAVPSIAFASWRLEVTDMETKEVRKFALPANSEFVVPMSLGGWNCVVGPESKYRGVKLLNMVCMFGDAVVAVSAGNGPNGEELVRLYRQKMAGFLLVLSWKSGR
jgi:hypothetical protein